MNTCLSLLFPQVRFFPPPLPGALLVLSACIFRSVFFSYIPQLRQDWAGFICLEWAGVKHDMDVGWIYGDYGVEEGTHTA
jgi:hypothetical protein